jgi:biotin-dependent carboxylase-like uncharacterized protein
MTLLVESPGILTLVQDLGRPGLGHLGVGPSGAFDRSALRQANALLGGPAAWAGLEVLGGGLALRATAPHTIAVTGAPADLRVDGSPIAYGRAVAVRPGQVLRVGPSVVGLRTYVGVAGGILARAELGSVATDTLAGLGPAPLSAGDELAVGGPSAVPDLEDVLPLGAAGDSTVDVVLGPRDDWFTAVAVRVLLESAWQVTPSSDRVGVRLSGPTLERSRNEELPSEPCVRGSIQVTADGQPIVLGPDHPVTGGYPVVAVVVDAHTDRLAQVGPGRTMRFRRTPPP